MSIRIHKDIIKKDHIEEIIRDLVVCFEDKNPTTLYFQDNDYIYIPMSYAKYLFNISSIDKNYPSIEIKSHINLMEPQKIVVDKCINILNEHNSVLLGAYPGFGKTVCSIYMASHFNLLTLILTHRVNLVDQWKNTILDYTESNLWVVGDEYVTNPKSSNNVIDFIISMDGRFNHLTPEILNQVGILIIDEAHLMMTCSRIPKILSVCPKYLILCDATPERVDALHKSLYALVSKENFVIVKNQKNIILHSYYTGIKFPYFSRYFKGKDSLDWNKTLESICEREQRNNFIVKSFDKYLKQGRKLLIMSSRKSHIEVLRKLSKQYYNDVTTDYLMGSKNEYSDSTILFGTISKMGVGFDEKGSCKNFSGKRIDVIFITTSFKNQAMTEQVIGRAMRGENPIIVEFIDEHNTLKSHYKKRLKVYKDNLGLLDQNITEFKIEDELKIVLIP